MLFRRLVVIHVVALCGGLACNEGSNGSTDTTTAAPSTTAASTTATDDTTPLTTSTTDSPTTTEPGGTTVEPGDTTTSDTTTSATATSTTTTTTGGMMGEPLLEPDCPPKTWCTGVIPNMPSIVDIWGLSRNDLWAVGGGEEPFIHRTADGWAEFILGLPFSNDPSPNAVVGGAPDDIWAGAGFGSVWHYDGNTWDYVDEASNFTERDIRAAWGNGNDNIYLGAEGGTLLHYNGSTWTATTLLPGELDIYAMWGSASNDVWAVGEAGEARHYDGNTWTDVPTGTANNLVSIWGSAPDDVWAGLFPWTTTILHWNGVTWTAVSSPVDDIYRGMWGDAPDNFWSVTEGGTILRFDGQSWTADHETGVDLRTLYGIDGYLYAAGIADTYWFRHE